MYWLQTLLAEKTLLIRLRYVSLGQPNRLEGQQACVILVYRVHRRRR
jgi:hypothetical protein